VITRTVCIVTTLLLASSELCARESIVGVWATSGNCGKPLSTIVVEPLALSGEDFSCEFTHVKRRLDTVGWSGRCTLGAEEEQMYRVTARLVNGQLMYRMGSVGWNGPLQRCAKRVR
jgi:hypothetical protein